MLGYAMCGSFCTHSESLAILKELSKEFEIVPIFSFNTYNTNTRFGEASTLIEKVESITNKKIVHSIDGAEPFGPSIPLDGMIISPCTGNTLAKLAHGITDTPVTMAAKAHMRCARPLVIALASNDALAANLENIALLLNRKNVYFVPVVQDDPKRKPHSLVADFSLTRETYLEALKGRQLRPIFLEKKSK